MQAANLDNHSKIQLNQKAKTSLLKVVKGMQPGRKEKARKAHEKLRILSIDGGGIRAILPAIILAELEECLKKESGDPQASIVDHFDLFAGTSAGAILTALYLTPGETDPLKPKFTAREVLELYLRDGCKSFFPANPNTSGLKAEKYCASVLEEKLKTLIGEETVLDELLKPAFFTAFNTTTATPAYFHSWEQTNYKAWQVARASSAAPGMFKPAIVEAYHVDQELVDGSIFAGNPAMCAFSLAGSTRFSTIPGSSSKLDFPAIGDQVMLSLGTGRAPKSNENKRESWIRMMMKNQLTSGIDTVDYQLKQLFSRQAKRSYFRLNPAISSMESEIDKTCRTHIDTLCRTGRQYLDEQCATITKVIQAIL